jgi:predicted membrane channel-forming protein YqfA (hemolysin III family)
MNNRWANWPQRPHPVLAVMLAIAICAVPILLPHATLRDLAANVFAYIACCVLAYPVAALLRHRITSLPSIWAIAVLFLLGLCFYHTNIITETADLPWPQRQDATISKFLFNLPTVSIGVLIWWALVLRPDQRR